VTSTDPQSGLDPKPETFFMHLQFYRLDPVFRTMMTNEKLVAKQEYLSSFDTYAGKLPTAVYGLTGLSADSDLAIWRLSPRIDDFHTMTSRLQDSGVGRYLRPVRSYLGTVPAALYPIPEEFGPGKGAGPIGRAHYLFVTELESWEDRPKNLEAEGGKPHILDGRGIDASAGAVLFETDDPSAHRSYLESWTKKNTGSVPGLLTEVHDLIDGWG